jgi:hypothetical protein
MNKEKDYTKQRRNNYGENSKSSRKNIPLSKHIQNRKVRRKFKEINFFDSEDAVNDFNAKIKIMKRFKKSPDIELGEILIKKLIDRYVLNEICFDDCLEKLKNIKASYNNFTIAFKKRIGYALNRILPEEILIDLKKLKEKVMV